MEIRRATQADAEIVAALIFALLDELSGSESSGYDVSNLTELTIGLMRSGEVVALLAEERGEAVGVIVLNGCASLYAGRFGEITELYVKPAFRSARVGEALLAAACAFARDKSWSRLEVGTPEQPAWIRTLAFYERNGFIQTGVRLKLPV